MNKGVKKRKPAVPVGNSGGCSLVKQTSSFMKMMGFIALAVILLFFMYSCVDYFMYRDRLHRNIFFENQSVSGMRRQEFLETFFALPDSELAIQISLRGSDASTVWSPDVLYIQKQQELVWNELYAVGRSDSFLLNLLAGLQRLFTQHRFDRGSLGYHVVEPGSIDSWVSVLGFRAPFDGSLEYVGGEISYELPYSGQGIDYLQLDQDLQEMIDSIEYQVSGHSLYVDTVEIEPQRTRNELFQNYSELKTFLSLPIKFQHEVYADISHEIMVDDFPNLLTLVLHDDDYLVHINDDAFAGVVQNLQPREAQLRVADDYSVYVEESRPGVRVDYDAQKESLTEYVASLGLSVGYVSISGDEYLQPALQTSDMKKLGIDHVVSEFTTYHGCCAARVDNIQLVGDLLDGYVIGPGQVLDINGVIGERTLEKGFKPAGSILKGELVDSVGGGISQFITTLHNAVYWGGYEIVSSKPHSIYFSRYPIGIEATINWPYVDYIFRNDTDHSVMIDVEYTDTSITVRILGSNYGRIAVGEHRGSTSVHILNNNSAARKVISSVSPPYNFRQPLVRYVSDVAVSQGYPVVERAGGQGYSVDVSRRVIQNDLPVHADKSSVHYFSDKDTIIRLHPCDNPNDTSVNCPVY